MTQQIGAPHHDAAPIGDVSAPPFAVLPDSSTLFERRAARFRTLAAASDLKPYLLFLAELSAAQHAIQTDLPAPPPLDEQARERAREFAMPPLDRAAFAVDDVFRETFRRLLAAAARIEAPAPTRAARERLTHVDDARLADMARAVLSDAVEPDELAEHIFVAAALQAHFARLAARLDADRLVAVGDALCPACGSAPASSVVAETTGSHGSRFCACATCQTQWNYVRVKCVACGSTMGVSYQEIEDGAGVAKAEVCDACGSYVKILYQAKEPQVDPIADDVASLGLDMLVRETGVRRAGVNIFLSGY